MTRIRFAIYNKITGAIRAICTSGNPELQLNKGEGIILLDGDQEVETRTHYVNVATPELVEQTEIPLTADKTKILADGLDTATVTLPVDTLVICDLERYQIDDGEFQFSTLLPGKYTLKFRATNYLDTLLEVTAV